MPRRLPLRDGYGIFAFRLASMSTCVCFVARFLQFYRAILRVGPSAVPFSVGWIRRRAIYRATSWVAQCSPSQPISRPQPPCESPRGRLLVGLPGRRSLSFGGDCRSCCCGGGGVPGVVLFALPPFPFPSPFSPSLRSALRARAVVPSGRPIRRPNSTDRHRPVPADSCGGFARRAVVPAALPPCAREPCRHAPGEHLANVPCSMACLNITSWRCVIARKYHFILVC